MLAGLTGNFGTGKSTVLRMFGQEGAIALSSDDIVKDLYKDPAIRKDVVELLGDVLDENGTVDRKRVSSIIFGNHALRKGLEGILHQRVIARIEETARDNPHDLVVAEIPLLFETGFQDRVDTVILTTCPEESIYSRLRKKGFSDTEISERLASQTPDSEKYTQVDYIINTDRGLAAIAREVNFIYNALIKKIKK
jgi:dephospho-CoA kinase